MRRLFVCDTCALIEFFQDVFQQGSRLSPRSLGIMNEATRRYETDVRLSIPSTVFVEIYEKWLRTEEDVRRFFFDVFMPIKECPNVEIKPIEREVIENMMRLDGPMMDHDMHDKIILASAMMLDCPLISLDRAVRDYNRANHVVPDVFY